MSRLKLSLLAAAIALGFSAATILPAEAATPTAKSEQTMKNKKKTTHASTKKKPTTRKDATKAKAAKPKPKPQTVRAV